MLYAPTSLVLAVQLVPRWVSVTVAVAPEIGAPLGSVIVPTTFAVTSWDHDNGAVAIVASINRIARLPTSHPCLLIARPPQKRRDESNLRTMGTCYIADEATRSRKK